MNSGRPVWHASISRAGRRTGIDPRRWGEGTFRDARRRLALALAGVGTGESVEHIGKYCVHLRRGLADHEIARLSPEWLAIPARDGFTEGGGMVNL